jgi:hypothetical protein
VMKPQANKQNTIAAATSVAVLIFWLIGVYAPELKAEATPEVASAMTGVLSYLIAKFKQEPKA